jgi:hypothetical protein
MKTLLWTLAIPALIGAPYEEARAMKLAEGGKAACVIVLASDAIAPEKTAAAELANYLREATGAEFAVRTEAEVASDAPQILVGQSGRARNLLPGVDWAALGRDGIVLKTCGNALVLAGGRPRGSLYAVYEFLEEHVGCRWWTSTESTIPSKPTLSIGAIDRVYVPKLAYREAFYEDPMADPLFAAKLRTNGHFEKIPADYGGHYTIIGFVHTFYPWLPPEKYFKDHPEWYSEIGGKRTTHHAQLCLTNADCVKEMTRVVLDKLREDPDAGMISVSQNDWGGRCECAKCKALEESEGSPSGPIIHFVNQVAEEVDKHFPGTLVETLAYSYSRKPPLQVKPRKNVIVRLCSIECSFSSPLESEVNKSFGDDIRGWRAIAPNLFIWDYVTDFAAYIQPHPNLRVLAPNLRFFVASNATGVFEQGDAYCSIGDFVRLRAWVFGRLMWDPARDPERLIDEFLNGYYGKAGPFLRQYLDLIHDACERKGVYLGCYNKDLSFLTLDIMNQAEGLWQKAEDAVRADPELVRRVRRDKLSLDHAWLIRYRQLKREAAATGKPFLGPADPVKAAEDFIQAARDWKVRNATEGMGFEAYVPELKNIVVPAAFPRDRLDALKAGSGEIGCDLFKLFRRGELSELVDDPKASGGKAARIPGSTMEWAVQWPVPLEIDDLKGKWKCSAMVRCDAKAGSGLALTCGIYHVENRVNLAFLSPTLEQFGDSEYHKIDLGVHELTSETYVWFAPPGNADSVGAVYVDRVILERP